MESFCVARLVHSSHHYLMFRLLRVSSKLGLRNRTPSDDPFVPRIGSQCLSESALRLVEGWKTLHWRLA